MRRPRAEPQEHHAGAGRARAPARAGAPGAAPAAPAALPQVQPFQLPVDELKNVAEGSGLQWVLSDAEKIAAAQAAMAAEPKPVHVPRERPPVQVADEGPLVLVETKRDLRNLKLPFEQQQLSEKGALGRLFHAGGPLGSSAATRPAGGRIDRGRSAQPTPTYSPAARFHASAAAGASLALLRQLRQRPPGLAVQHADPAGPARPA